MYFINFRCKSFLGNFSIARSHSKKILFQFKEQIFQKMNIDILLNNNNIVSEKINKVKNQMKTLFENIININHTKYI